MKTETIVCCVVALLLGMLLANMLKSVCGCKLTEGNHGGFHAELRPMTCLTACEHITNEEASAECTLMCQNRNY